MDGRPAVGVAAEIPIAAAPQSISSTNGETRHLQTAKEPGLHATRDATYIMKIPSSVSIRLIPVVNSKGRISMLTACAPFCDEPIAAIPSNATSEAVSRQGQCEKEREENGIGAVNQQ